MRVPSATPPRSKLIRPARSYKNMQIGRYQLPNAVFVAPMAGVTDRPFRRLCRALGAGYAVSEMAASNPKLWDSVKTTRRIDHQGEIAPRAVQLAGGDAAMLAQAARFNVQHGAQIIDINMGCPARKVCNVAAGSALMADEPKAVAIVEAVVNAVGRGPDAVPVTVKMRTGPAPQCRNAVRLATQFVDAGAAMITVHGRTRACAFRGEAEYETIAAVKAALSGRRGVPVVANGDIRTPRQAQQVLRKTGADAVMIGRAAQGRPWIFREINAFLERGAVIDPPTLDEVYALMTEHLLDHYHFYGELTGVRTARKHLAWYSQHWPNGAALRTQFNPLETPEEQLALLERWFSQAISDAPQASAGTPTEAPEPLLPNHHAAS